jgi:hypothetical protein
LPGCYTGIKRLARLADTIRSVYGRARPIAPQHHSKKRGALLPLQSRAIGFRLVPEWNALDELFFDFRKSGYFHDVSFLYLDCGASLPVQWESTARKDFAFFAEIAGRRRDDRPGVDVNLFARGDGSAHIFFANEIVN